MSQLFIKSIENRYGSSNRICLFKKQGVSLKTTVDPLHCCVCEQGLEEEMSITAKVIGGKPHFFCSLHYPE